MLITTIQTVYLPTEVYVPLGKSGIFGIHTKFRETTNE